MDPLIEPMLDALSVKVIREQDKRPRYRIRTVDRTYIEVHEALVNWRIVELPTASDDDPGQWTTRYWCYKGKSVHTFVAAILAACAWNGSRRTEPQGWVKSWDGRRDGEGPVARWD